MSKSIAARDERNYLLMTAGFVKGLDYLRWAARSPVLRSFDAPDEALGSLEMAASWLSNALARRALVTKGGLQYDMDIVKTVPLETWVIAPGDLPDAPLHRWFEYCEAPGSYRILIHRSPLKHDGKDIPVPWEGVYGRVCPIDRPFDVSTTQRAAGEHFLEELLQAYRLSPREANALMVSQPHPYRIWRDDPILSPNESDTPGRVRVPQAVLDAIEDVRDSGLTNMMDRTAVQRIANDLEHYETVIWLEDNRKLYAEGLFRGFEAEDEKE